MKPFCLTGIKITFDKIFIDSTFNGFWKYENRFDKNKMTFDKIFIDSTQMDSGSTKTQQRLPENQFFRSTMTYQKPTIWMGMRVKTSLYQPIIMTQNFVPSIKRNSFLYNFKVPVYPSVAE